MRGSAHPSQQDQCVLRLVFGGSAGPLDPWSIGPMGCTKASSSSQKFTGHQCSRSPTSATESAALAGMGRRSASVGRGGGGGAGQAHK